MTYEEAISFDALYAAMMKCKHGVSWKDSVAHFILNGSEECLKLEKQLKDGTYKPRPTKSFKITSPKPRDVVSIAFRDRVYQRSLNDNILYPAMTKSFIYDNWACQKGKGTMKAKKRFEELLRRYYRKHGCDGYVSQWDIHGYYPSMKHDEVEKCFRAKLERDSFNAVRAVLRGQYEGEKGYNPGSQMVQIAGISILDGLDHFIKEQLHIKVYIRYMDDFILVHQSKEYLEQCNVEIEKRLNEIGFEPNKDKTRTYPLREGVTFLGFEFKLTETGKVLKHIKQSNVRNERKKLRRLVAKAKRGEVSKTAVDASYRSWRDHAAYGTNRGLLLRMDKYYKNLWRCESVRDQSQE